MKRGRVDTKTIPGGKALGQYLAQVVVAKQHHEESQLKKLKAKLERQKVIAKKVKESYENVYANRARKELCWCKDCGVLVDREDSLDTIYCGTHGCFCKEDCSFKGTKCPRCYHSCDYPGGKCETAVKCTDRHDQFECEKCSAVLCKDHTEYCRWCGCVLCLDSECARKHEGECEQKKKK